MPAWFIGMISMGLLYASEDGLPRGRNAGLAKHAHSVLAALGTEQENQVLRSFLNHYDVLRKEIEESVRLRGAALGKLMPEMKERIDRETEGFPAVDLREAVIALYGETTIDEVLNSWRNQMRVNLEQVLILLKGNPEEIRQHQWVWYEDLKIPKREFFCSVQLRDCMKEARKVAALLTAPQQVIQVERGGILFQERFDSDLSNWELFGEADAGVRDGRLRVSGAPFTMWTRGGDDAGDRLVGLDLTPGEERGGVILAFPGSPKGDLDYSVSAGRGAPTRHLPPGHKDPMEPYNWGIHTYHVSVHRGRTHLRRTGEGLKMLNIGYADPCSEKHRRYRVEILQVLDSIQVIVDGRLVHHYVDAGVYGPPLTHGRFGIKQFGRITAWYDNIEVCSLSRSKE